MSGYNTLLEILSYSGSPKPLQPLAVGRLGMSHDQ